MLIRHAIPGLIKLALIVLLPGPAVGAAAGLFWPRDYKKWATRLLVAFIAIIEVAVLIEKSQPFFFGNVYDMVAMTPNFGLHVAIGLIGDGLWLFLSIRSAKKTAGKVAARRKSKN
jgi:phosphoglycerol transferase MdoB-like AlkP superfamily enzyme